MLKQQVGALTDAGSHHKESCGRNIGRHIDFAGLQGVTGFDSDRGAIHFDRITKTFEHTLGMVAGGRRLSNRGAARGVETRQQHAGFNLSAGHRHCVIHAHQATRTTNAQRRPAFVTRIDLGSHFTQRFSHATHGTPGQGGVAGQYGIKGLSGE